jgi:serine/threonine protein kinase/tetratricopeptide (TPR) repeat protein
MKQPARLWDQEAGSQVLNDVVDQITENLQAGTPFDLEDYVRQYPELEDQLRKLLPGIQMLADLGYAPGDWPPPASLATSNSQKPTQGVLGDYRFVREIGRGGMGVVYEAEQVSLGRKVALKVLPFAAMMDQRQLQRFQNEARAAASLRHPNVVQVHHVGCERAVHFYAMDYIEGQTLADLIHHLRRIEGLEGDASENGGEGILELADSLVSGRFAPPDKRPDAVVSTVAIAQDQTPGGAAENRGAAQAATSTEPSTRSLAYFRSIVEIGVQVADALDHAHEHGVIHRDIKPSNVILDNTGKPWVTDFGLARIESDAPLTVSGDLLGTVRYMSPEQALAKRIVIDQRTDVYSLGATLYELLTLRPVFSGQDRQELLRQIAFEEPKPPRKAKKAIPEELEIIVLKAMAKNPAERYDTAQELADDLRRFLEDKPIRAKRPSLIQRAAKWSRRHKPVVWSAAVSVVALLVLGLIGLGIGNVIITKERDEKEAALHAKTDALDEKEQALLSAKAERQRAQGNLDLALEALDAVYLDAIGEEKLLGEPLASPNQNGDAGSIPQRDLSKFEKELLDRGLTFYAQFAERNRQTSQAKAHTARAYYRVALLQGAIEERDSAEVAYTEAINRFKALIRNEPQNHRFHYDLSQAYFGLARIQPKWKEAEQMYLKADDAMTAAIKIKPDAAEYYRGRSVVRDGVGDYRHAQHDAEKATELASGDVEFHLHAASQYVRAPFKYKDWKKAIMHCERALDSKPDDARAHAKLGYILSGSDPERALEHLSKAIEIDPTDTSAFDARARLYLARCDFERALSDASDVIRLTSGRSGHQRRATIHVSMGRFLEAKVDLVAMEKRIPPASPNYAGLLDLRADVHIGLGDYASAVDDLTRAIRQRPLLYWLVEHRGVAYFHMGQYEKSLEDIKTSCELAPPGHGIPLFVIPRHLVTTCPSRHFREGLLATAQSEMEGCRSVRVWASYADLLKACGRDEAQKAYETATKLFAPHDAAYYDHYQYALLCLRFERDVKYRQCCAAMLSQFGDSDESIVANYVAWTGSLAPDALKNYDRAVALAEKALNARPESRQFLNTLGAVLYRAGRHKQAIKRLTQLDRRRGAVDDIVEFYLPHTWDSRATAYHTSPAYTWYFMAMAYHKAGNAEQAREYLAKANAWTHQSLTAEKNGFRWHRLATLELLRKEAEIVLGIDVDESAGGRRDPDRESNRNRQVELDQKRE